jgi:hypothetical protein
MEEHELIYFWYFLGFLVMKTINLLDYIGNCKLTYLQAYLFTIQLVITY